MEKQDFVIASIIGIVLILAGGAFVYIKVLPQNRTGEAQERPLIVEDFSEPSPSVAVQNGTATEVEIPRQQESTLEERLMADPASVKAELTDITGGSSSGTAYMLRKNGQLFHTVSARLPEPTNGEFYEGWLIKELPRLTSFSTGKLRKLDNGLYFLAFNADEEYPDFSKVVVTIETSDDGKPERHVLVN